MFTPEPAPRKAVTVSSTRAVEAIRSPQGQQLFACLTNDMCGAEQISAGVVVMPAGRMSRPHLHQRSEIIVVCIQGWAATLVGPGLRPVFHGPGEFIFVPEQVLHVALNLSTTQPLIAVEARGDRHFNDDVVVFPELEDEAARAVDRLRDDLATGRITPPSHWVDHDVDLYRYADELTPAAPKQISARPGVSWPVR
jgi:uncharacterized RmlC-like cupin family protein